MGFYSYALISVQSAARVAALATAALPNTTPTATVNTLTCPLVLKELATMPNVGSSVTTCGAINSALTASNPGQRF